MGRDIVKAKLDVIFKKLFTSNNEVLRGFLSDILDIPKEEIKKLEIINPNILPAYIEGKQGQLDLKMQVDEKIINVEIQLRNKGDFKDRALYYWAKMFSDEIKRGGDYNDLKQTIAINIVDFRLFDCDDFYSTFTMIEKNRHEKLTDKCSIIFLELVKRAKKVNRNDRKMLWVQLIDAETEEELDMLNETGVPEIQEAVMILHEMSADEEIREMARLREKWIRDEKSLIRTSKEEGRAEGKAEGRAEERAEILANMRKLGFSEEQIQKVKEMSENE